MDSRLGCEKYKTLWHLTFETAYENALSGARPSSDYLSAFRLVRFGSCIPKDFVKLMIILSQTFGAFNYLNSAPIRSRMRNINDNIKLELSNAKAVTDHTIPDLDDLWDEWTKKQFADMDNKAKKNGLMISSQ